MGDGIDMGRTEEFIEEYKRLERTVRSAYNLEEADSIAYYLKRSDRC